MKRVNLNVLTEVVQSGGSVRIGVDIYSPDGNLLIEKDRLIRSPVEFDRVSESGLSTVPLLESSDSGVWKSNGERLPLDLLTVSTVRLETDTIQVTRRLKEILELRREAGERWSRAADVMRTAVAEVRRSGGEFDVPPVRRAVSDLLHFLTYRDRAFAYLDHDVLRYEGYPYNHAVGVSVIATTALRRFNENLEQLVNAQLEKVTGSEIEHENRGEEVPFIYHLPGEVADIALGYFLHDIGKALLPPELLDQPGTLTEEGYRRVQTHSHELGVEILEKNGLSNPYLVNTVALHHAPLYLGEEKCYPNTVLPAEVPVYVKICKLADIYDAMTSKRVYREAISPMEAVSAIFRHYSGKNRMLQFLLFSFVKLLGVYPPGSVVYLKNGQMAYVLDSSGPVVLPFTDSREMPLSSPGDALNLSKCRKEEVQVDRYRPVKSPREVQEILPTYLRRTA